MMLMKDFSICYGPWGYLPVKLDSATQTAAPPTFIATLYVPSIGTARPALNPPL